MVNSCMYLTSPSTIISFYNHKAIFLWNRKVKMLMGIEGEGRGQHVLNTIFLHFPKNTFLGCFSREMLGT